MLNTKLINAIQNFVTHTVLVVGDVMIDTYYTGSVNRVSPEAPVPVLDLDTITHKLGGAANVASNISALGAKAMLLSVTGNDATAQQLQALLTQQNITAHLIVDESRCTTQKTRYIAQQNQLLRVDNETKTELVPAIENELIARFLTILTTSTIDAVIIEDYNKGVLTPKVINELINACAANKIKVFVDPKKDNFFEYKNVTVFKPNLKEIVAALQLKTTDEETIKKVATDLRAQLNSQLVMVTLADKGILIASAENTGIIPAKKRSVADVSGAGDTVIAATALCSLQNLSWYETATLSNLAGGVVCEKMGVVTISSQELIAEVIKSIVE